MRTAKHIHRMRGFSLLELAVVLIIIGLLAGLGITLGGNIMSGADRVTTQERLIVIRQALDAFATKNGYLPCPASRALIPTDANFGVQQRGGSGQITSIVLTNDGGSGYGSAPNVSITGGGGSGAAATAIIQGGKVIGFSITNPGSNYPAGTVVALDGGAFTQQATASATVGGGCLAVDPSIQVATGVFIGALPTQTLGLPAAYAADAWNNKLLYAVSANHVSEAGSYAQNTGSITVKSGDLTPNPNNANDPYILTGNYDPSNANGPPPPHLTDNWATNYSITSTATYAVVSHGPDGKGAYPLQGTAIVGTLCGAITTGNNIDNENCDGTNATFYDTEYNDGSEANRFFDDYIIWSTNTMQRMPEQVTGTVLAGSTVTTIKLASNASATNDAYNGWTITITGGTGSGQSTTITDYDGTNKTATVAAQGTIPDTTSSYRLSSSLTAGLGTGCAAGMCDAWCAPCLNLPVYSAASSTSFTSYVCKSTVISHSPCQANCVYAYFDTSTVNSSGGTLSIPCQ